MKTSKIIFIAFFSVLALFLMSLMIDISHDPKLFGHEHALPPFSHLVVKGKPKVNIILANQSAKSDSLSFYFTKDDNSSKGLYQTKGDTLLIDVENCDGLNHVTLKCQKLPVIEAYSATLYLSGDNTVHLSDTVSIVGTSSFIEILNINFDTKMNVLLNDKSTVYCYTKNIENVTISLNNSNGFFKNGVINEFKGILSDNSSLNVSNVTHLNITSDKSSKYWAFPN